jgi:hypothetical protein
VVAACAYCKGFIALRDPVEDPSITHGICEACLAEQLREFGSELADSAPGFSWSGESVPDSLAMAGSAR